jgi:outer membrane protein TolC
MAEDDSVMGSTLNVQVASISLNSRLREAYAGALYAKEYLALSHRIDERRQENVRFTQIRYESGLEYKWVYLSSNAKLKQSQLSTEQAEWNKKTALLDLVTLLGPLPIQSVEDVDDSDFFNVDTAYDIDQLMANLDKNPKYLLQKARMDGAVSTVDLNRANYYPIIGFEADAYVMNTEKDHTFPFWFAELGLRIPFFQGGRLHRNVEIARRQLSQVQFDLEQTRTDLKKDLERNYENYLIAKKQVEVSKLTVEAVKDRAKVVSNQYRSGLTNFLDWESSQDGWVSAEVDLLTNIRNYYVSRGKLEEAIGIELDEKL